jgi:hypothetical protein
MIFYSGVDDDYPAHGRPAVLHLVFSNGQSDTITPRTSYVESLSPRRGNHFCPGGFGLPLGPPGSSRLCGQAA